MQDFKQLQVWQRAHACFLAVHNAFQPDRAQAVSGLRAQAIRAAASIPANIAEGCGKTSTRELIRFLEIAAGSTRELENHLIVARDLEVVSYPQFCDIDDRLTHVRRMLSGMRRSLLAQRPKNTEAIG